MTNRKLKKRLQKEADTLLQAKKEEMLSFYRPAGAQREKGHRFPVRVLVAASLTAILLATVVFAVSFGGSRSAVDPPMSDPASSAESISAVVSESVPPEPSEPAVSAPSAAFEIPPWVSEIRTPFTVAEIVEVTEETVELYSRYNGHNTDRYESTKVLCRILYSYRPEYFDMPFNYMGVDVDNYVPFEELQEIYVASASAKELKAYDRIFFQPNDMYANGHVYYGPVTDDQGRAEYLPFVDGKIHMTEEALELASFMPIREVNQEVEELLAMADRGHQNELSAVCPRFVCKGELDLAQIEEFFQGCKALSEAFDKSFHGCCVVYDPEG